MEFSTRNIDGQRISIYDSGKDSKIQLIFLPGVYSAEAWKFQTRYFSQNHRVITYKPIDSNSLEEQKYCLKTLLEKKGLENVVLIAANYSNPLAQEFEDRENVTGTVLVGAKEETKIKISKTLYNTITSGYFPEKLVKKLFFPSMDYREVKSFCNTVKFVDFEHFRSFRKVFTVRRPENDCMIVHGKRDFFSSEEYARSLMNAASVSLMDTGSFSFFEKPQEFNKTLNDFILKLERKAEDKEVEETRRMNRTLVDFEKKEKVKIKR